MRTLFTLVTIPILFGCQPRVALTEAPIIGGTPRQRALVEAELLRFDGWTEGHTTISKVEFVDPEVLSSQHGFAGAYAGATGTIFLADHWGSASARC